jgi:hypothetical protein
MGKPRGVHGERKGVYNVLVAKHEGKEPSENLGMDGIIISNGFSRSGMVTWTAFI